MEERAEAAVQLPFSVKAEAGRKGDERGLHEELMKVLLGSRLRYASGP